MQNYIALYRPCRQVKHAGQFVQMLPGILRVVALIKIEDKLHIT